MADAPDQWNRLLTPASLREYGATSFAPPGGPFEPTGAWAQTWQIWMLKRGSGDTNHRGFIRLSRSAVSEADTYKLSVKQDAVQRAQGAVHETEANIRCAADPLGTPLEWEIRTRLYSAREGREFSVAALSKRGSRESVGISGPVTCSWSILEAVQRLRNVSGLPAFVLLDELDKPKPGHRLTSAGEIEIPFGENNIPVRRYHQIGQGLLPWIYYVDKTGRLLLALSGLRAYILNPEAEEIHTQEMAKLAGRRRP